MTQSDEQWQRNDDPESERRQSQSVAPWRPLIDGAATLIPLGVRDRRAYFALDATTAELSASEEAQTMDERAAAAIIDGGEAAILAEARSLIDWHARHRFCAQCGTPSVALLGGGSGIARIARHTTFRASTRS